VPVATVESAAVKGGLTTDEAHAVAGDYGDAQLDALRLFGAVALASLLSLWFTRRLSTTSVAEGDGDVVEPTAATSTPGAPAAAKPNSAPILNIAGTAPRRL
jgi:hypothetical protein